MSEWSVTEPSKLTFDEPVTDLHVRIVAGTVNVVGTDEGCRPPGGVPDRGTTPGRDPAATGP
ncbi:hypothetical protein SVIOM74S_06310 [Streptomyces violarus]